MNINCLNVNEKRNILWISTRRERSKDNMKILEPIMVGNLRIKNRIGMAPMGHGQKDVDGGYSQGQREYYAERAKGGVGMIFCGALISDMEGAIGSLLDNPAFYNRFEQATDMIHGYGAKVCMQLVVGTGRVGGAIPGVSAPVSASAIPAFWNSSVTCRALETEEVEMLVKKMGEGAKTAQRAGFDCVEIHAYGGYLMDQFMSAAWNKRTDKYGGDLKGRMRFLLEGIEEIQKVCGKQYPIIVKYSPEHYFEGGRDIEEGKKIAKMLEEAGVSALHVDPGSYETWNKIITPVYEYKTNYSLEAAGKIKEVVKIPVMANGHFGDPEYAESALQSGKIDYILLGRPLLADPEWVVKVKERRTDDIIPCIRCNKGCMERCFAGLRTGCALNPITGREKQNQIIPKGNKHPKVLVAGGGPGGCEAALTAAELGYEVELWEKTGSLGGDVAAAAGPVFKKDMRRLVEYYKVQVSKHSGIKVKYLKEATPEAIRKEKFDLVISAIGGVPIVPKLEGLERENVMLATDVLRDRKFTGEKVVIIGGGLVGIETALDLDMKGKKVTVVEMKDKILAENLFPIERMALNEMISKSSIDMKPGHKLLKVDDRGVQVESMSGEQSVIPCDTVVLAMGYKPNMMLENELLEDVPDIITIGNAERPATILKAVWEGYHAVKTYAER